MRRPNVYQRSAPWARRDVGQEAGAVALARYFGQVLNEAEGIVGRAP